MARIESSPPRERSAIASIHTEEREGPPFIVYADCRLTRRKRHHMIADGRDSTLFRSRWWSDILEWLANEQITDYEVVTDRDRFRCHSEAVATQGKE